MKRLGKYGACTGEGEAEHLLKAISKLLNARAHTSLLHLSSTHILGWMLSSNDDE